MKFTAVARILSLAGVLVFAGSAHAAITTFTNLGTFTGSAGTTTLENFSAAPVGFSTANFNGTFTGFSLAAASNGNNTGIATGTMASSGDNTPIPGAFAGQNFFGWGNVFGSPGATSVFTPLIGATAFGFDFFNTDSTDDYTVAVNGIVLGSINFVSSGFLGFVANAGDTINSVTIKSRATGGYVSTAGIDNVRVSAPAVVPEPMSLMLVGVGLAAAALTRRNKARALAA